MMSFPVMTTSDPKLLSSTLRGSAPGPARSSYLRQTNARELLRLVQHNEPCSKADLVRLSGLSAPSVSTMVAHLQELGLVISVGEGESNGGRPPEILRFNARHGYVAGVDIGGTRLRMILADLNGSPVAQWSTVLARPQKTPEAIGALIDSGLREMCRTHRISRRKIFHLTAGAPGITDIERGIVLAAPNLNGWVDIPLQSLLAAQLDLPVNIENDVNLAALGEHRSGAARDVRSFIFLAIGTGVGAGVFLHGRLHHGSHWTAGEIGYFGVRQTPPAPVRVRSTGQLEDVLGGEGIERAWHDLLHAESVHDGALEKLRPPAIFDLAESGHALAGRVLNKAAELLADTITSISLLLDPELIVLGGGLGSHPELARATSRLLAKNEFANPPVRSSVLKTEAQLFGAVSLALSIAETALVP